MERLINRNPFRGNMVDEFKQWGISIPNLSKIFGGILTLWGAFSYFAQSADPPSITALIPAFMGFPLLMLGLLSDYNPANRHHFMHASMVMALLMALAGGLRLATNFSDMSTLVLVSHVLLTGLGAAFVFAGVRSFRHARLRRGDAQ